MRRDRVGGGRSRQVVEHLAEHAVCMSSRERVGEQRCEALVDRGGAHLHRRGEADLVADHAQVEPGRRHLCELSGTSTGEVDARPVGGPRRRARDRPVDELEPGGLERPGDLARCRRRDGVPVGDERPRSRPGRGGGELGRNRDRLVGRRDREHQVGAGHDGVELGKQLEPGPLREPTRPFASPGHRGDDARAACPGPAAPTALPIAPGLTIPTVAIGRTISPGARAAYFFAAVFRLRVVPRDFGVDPLPFATSPVGASDMPACLRSFVAISAISSGA